MLDFRDVTWAVTDNFLHRRCFVLQHVVLSVCPGATWHMEIASPARLAHFSMGETRWRWWRRLMSEPPEGAEMPIQAI